jgi:glucose-6-phosphate 1-dehydrogenase
LRSQTAEQGETIIQRGDISNAMYLISRGEVEVLDGAGKLIQTLKDGDFFGEIGLLMTSPRTATVKAKSLCDLFVLAKTDFCRILRDHPQFADQMMGVAKERYDVVVSAEQLMTES